MLQRIELAENRIKIEIVFLLTLGRWLAGAKHIFLRGGLARLVLCAVVGMAGLRP